MNVRGIHYRTIWENEKTPNIIHTIDQRWLPFNFLIAELKTVEDVKVAIKDMIVRGAGLIGVTAAYGIFLATLEAAKTRKFDEALRIFAEEIRTTRPTAVNLEWAVNRQLKAIENANSIEQKQEIALKTARIIADEDAEISKRIGKHGLEIIKSISNNKGDKPVNILTHCNAGWLAFVDYGTATAPIYAAHDLGLSIHVWVDETRPRNQGARLTAWELNEHGVPHTVIADNVGGHLMQHGLVDMVIVGTDRTTRYGDVANKVGTYLKALAAHDNQVPFYVALPSSSIDWNLKDGVKDIPIEERGGEEVKYISGWSEDREKEVLLTPKSSAVANYAFDVTPARLVTGLITERGICDASESGILNLFPEFSK